MQRPGSKDLNNFNPRSPCGERRCIFAMQLANYRISIHALLAESDRSYLLFQPGFGISIHALLAESDMGSYTTVGTVKTFQSTLSLRRATPSLRTGSRLLAHFNPRSPCGERRQLRRILINSVIISIHALLAESDASGVQKGIKVAHFNPRSPCGERP